MNRIVVITGRPYSQTMALKSQYAIPADASAPKRAPAAATRSHDPVFSRYIKSGTSAIKIRGQGEQLEDETGNESR